MITLILDGGLGDELIYRYSPDPVKSGLVAFNRNNGEWRYIKKLRKAVHKLKPMNSFRVLERTVLKPFQDRSVTPLISRTRMKKTLLTCIGLILI